MDNTIKLKFIEDFGTPHAKTFDFTAAGIINCMKENGDKDAYTFAEYFDSIVTGHFPNIKLIRSTEVKDKNEELIWEGDKITFWLCYRTTQTHRGDNIPGGSYTEPDESQLVKVTGEVYYDDTMAAWSWSILGDAPYAFNQHPEWFTTETVMPILGRMEYDPYSIVDMVGGDIDQREQLDELIKEITGVEDFDTFFSEVNKIERVGSVYIPTA